MIPLLTLKVAGFDPSLRHWGIATGVLDIYMDKEKLTITGLDLIEPVIPKSKQVRISSKDLTAATQLATKAFEIAGDVDLVFVEVPHGSQSARAMAGYGICLGILGVLWTQKGSCFQVSADEVKIAMAKDKNATKRQMIQAAYDTHPEAQGLWPMRTVKGDAFITESKAEHMADAVATIHAGLQTPAFKQFLPLAMRLNP